MKYVEASLGRVFVLRLEHGDIVHEVIENFAEEKGIAAAAVTILGGADAGSRLVVGPEEGTALPVTAMTLDLPDVHEVVGTGTLFRDEADTPLLHLHLACGRQNRSMVGCIRQGVKVWRVMEAVVLEINGLEARRRMSPLGFKLLEL